MSKLFLLILIISTVCISGCQNYSRQFNATSNGDCTVQCANFAQQKLCTQGVPSYSDSMVVANENITNSNKCDCAVLECFR